MSLLQQDAARYREHADICLIAAKIATAPGLAAAFERLAKTWLDMADELERNEPPSKRPSQTVPQPRCGPNRNDGTPLKPKQG